MDNESILAELFNGTANTVEFPIEGLQEPLTLRPLTNGELLELKKLEKGNQEGLIKVKRGMDKEDIKKQVQDLESNIKYKDLIQNEQNTKYKAIQLSASLSNAMIGKLPAKIYNELFDKIMEISQITEDDLDLLKDFRKDS